MNNRKKIIETIIVIFCLIIFFNINKSYQNKSDSANISELESVTIEETEIRAEDINTEKNSIEEVNIEEVQADDIMIDDIMTETETTSEMELELKDVYDNVDGNYIEDIIDDMTGIKYNIWIPEGGSENKSVIFCSTGFSKWEDENLAFSPHLVIKQDQITPDAVIIIIQKTTAGSITDSYSEDALSAFINQSIILQYKTSIENVYYYGFSMGGSDFEVLGPLYNWKAAAFTDGNNAAMNAATYCKSLKAIMYNNSSETPNAWNKANADLSSSTLGLTEGQTYIWNMINGTHANINQYAIIETEGQGNAGFSRNCIWEQKECDEMPRSLNWLLQW